MTTVERMGFDGVLVIGGGLAGLSAALAAAPRPAMVLAAAPLGDGCSSAWAQGGMAAALSEDDAPALHAADTLAAGAGLCDPEAVAILTREGPEAVTRLAELGAPFDRRSDGGFVQSLEAAHGRARVARVGGDGAGRAIMAAVIEAVARTPAITVRQGFTARRLLTDATGRVRGALVQDLGGRLLEIVAPATVLATGGLGGLYAVTTTPREVMGEGLAMAALAGAVIADPEFVQFHPTAMDLGLDPAPLATEALRGEGATLVGADGQSFMARYHPAAELAPRDVVARAIEAERRAGRGAFLDARAAVGEAFPREFPAVFAAAMAAGLDPRRAPIPVAPAVHYHMGGVETDVWGRTSLAGLLAAGECAATGAHGANRLASNSLLEAAVFGARAGRTAAVLADPGTPPLPAAPPPELPEAQRRALRRAMSRGAGVIRTGAGLARLLADIGALEAACGSALPLIAARLVAQGALARRESRGAHFRSDYPAAAAPARSRILLPPVAGNRDQRFAPSVAA
jgi:L-aspartate oxidase